MADHAAPYGVGIAYRSCLHQQLLKHAEHIDVLEVPTEDYIIRQRRLHMDPTGELLAEAVDRFPCVAHGIAMSFGSVEPFDEHYMTSTRQFLDETGIEVFSEHLAFHRMDDVDLTVFLAMPFDDLSIEWLAARYRQASALLGRPIDLENVSYHCTVPGSQYDEPGFLARFLEAADATLLLDVTNVYNNCVNHNQDPVEYIQQLPPHRIRQLHLAGGHYHEGFLLDSHSKPVMEPVWDLLDVAVQHTHADVIVIERDTSFEPFEQLVDEMIRAREIFHRHRPATRPDRPVLRAAEPADPDPLAERYSDLRSFQRALIRSITDEGFRSGLKANPETGLAEYPMQGEWTEKFESCRDHLVPRLAHRWQSWQEQARRLDEHSKRQEWAQWAAQAD